MISIEEALVKLKNVIPIIGTTIQVPIWECVGKVLAQEIIAPMNVPPYPKSAMDGYAVCAKDVLTASHETPVQLKVLGEIFAGDYCEIPYEPNGAIRVMTGSYIPEGYDAIIKQEDTDYGDEIVQVYNSVNPYQNYCKIGEDIQKGSLIYPKGTKLNTISSGILASVGFKTICVYEPLKIGILSTGSELVPIDQPLEPGKIYNSISYMLATMISSAGYSVVHMDICQDDINMLQEKIHAMLKDCHILITTGGVSVGKKDLLPQVLELLQAQILFHGVDMQPGTPIMGSILEGTPILSFSGNPYAALVNFELFFWETANLFYGIDQREQVTDYAILQNDYTKINKRRRFIRAIEKQGQVWIPEISHAASIISSMEQCNCLVDIEVGCKVNKGEKVRIRYIKSR